MIEHAHDDLLAKQRAQRGDAEVDLRAVVGRRAQAAVLRQPLLGDVHARHDLEPRDQPFMDPLGQVHHLLEQPVEAMPDEHALFHRLDVHVAGVALDGALHDEVDEIDDRRGLAALLQARDRLEDVLLGAARERRLAGRRAPRVAPPGATARRAGPGRSPQIGADLRRADERLVGIAGLGSPRGCRRASATTCLMR